MKSKLKSWFNYIMCQNDQPVPEEEDSVLAPAVESKIKEPILSFVSFYKKNHRKFSIDVGYNKSEDVTEYVLVDNINNIKYFISRRFVPCFSSHFYVFENFRINEGEIVNTFTREEIEYAFNQVSSFMNERVEKLTTIKSARIRAKLIKVYGNE